jgi:hypothetical protein
MAAGLRLADMDLRPRDKRVAMESVIIEIAMTAAQRTSRLE